MQGLYYVQPYLGTPASPELGLPALWGCGEAVTGIAAVAPHSWILCAALLLPQPLGAALADAYLVQQLVQPLVQQLVLQLVQQLVPQLVQQLVPQLVQQLVS